MAFVRAIWSTAEEKNTHTYKRARNELCATETEHAYQDEPIN